MQGLFVLFEGEQCVNQMGVDMLLQGDFIVGVQEAGDAFTGFLTSTRSIPLKNDGGGYEAPSSIYTPTSEGTQWGSLYDLLESIFFIAKFSELMGDAIK
jgi:hypothetical protein